LTRRARPAALAMLVLQLMLVERIEEVDTAINGLRKSANQLFRRL